jgi:hypothetical protein
MDVSAGIATGQLQSESPDDASANEPARTLPSWLISFGFHALALLSLWPIQIASSMIRDSIVSASVVDEEEAVNPLQQDAFHFDAAVGERIGNGGDSSGEGERVAMLGPSIETPRAPVVNVQGAVSMKGAQQIAIRRPMLDVGAAAPDRELSDLVETVSTSEHAGGVRGAIDRLTFEIETSLRQDNTLVIWLFDATPSMKERREAIAERFENIYRQLGLLGVGGNGALKTVVGTFGRTTEYITQKPIDDVKSIQKAIRKIGSEEDDEKDSVENVFGATLDVASRYGRYATSKKDRRRVMVVIVTDERGSDFPRVEEAIGRLRKSQMRVYCVGNDAGFGREKHFFPYVFHNGLRGTGFTLRGPESLMLENLQLAFWGRHNHRFDEMTSSFGPYALCRLCSETGGMFLISEELGGAKFDPMLMRNYAPDYRPIHEYEAEIAKNAAKSGLIRAAKEEAEQEIPRPATVFRADNDNTLRQQITQAQKPLAVLGYRLNEISVPLLVGEKERPQLDTPRWKASFDLAVGRVLAMQARAVGYNQMLADMKVSPHPFQNPNDNTWRIVPASEEHCPQAIQKLIKRAREYLGRVIEEHRGTPWELLAREELRTPMGWDWQESFVDYPPPPSANKVARNPVQLEEDRQRQMIRRQEQEAQVPRKL